MNFLIYIYIYIYISNCVFVYIFFLKFRYFFLFSGFDDFEDFQVLFFSLKRHYIIFFEKAIVYYFVPSTNVNMFFCKLGGAMLKNIPEDVNIFTMYGKFWV